MKKLFIIISLLVCQQFVQAGVFIKINLKDSVACQSAFNTLSVIDEVDGFKIIFPELFRLSKY